MKALSGKNHSLFRSEPFSWAIVQAAEESVPTGIMVHSFVHCTNILSNSK
jgi:hypothetical protein